MASPQSLIAQQIRRSARPSPLFATSLLAALEDELPPDTLRDHIFGVFALLHVACVWRRTLTLLIDFTAARGAPWPCGNLVSSAGLGVAVSSSGGVFRMSLVAVKLCRFPIIKHVQGIVVHVPQRAPACQGFEMAIE